MAYLRNYRRIFNVDKRIYQIEGRQLPIPGGVPLRFAVWFIAAEITVVLVRSQSPIVAILCVGIGLAIGNRRQGALGALIGGVLGWAVATVTGFLLALPDWPIPYVILPAALAVLSIRYEPDGRAPHRFVLSWLRFQSSPRRRVAGYGGVSPVGTVSTYAPDCWIASDWNTPELRKARVTGPTTVEFRDALTIRRRGVGKRRRWVATPAKRRRDETQQTIDLADGEVLEIRP